MAELANDKRFYKMNENADNPNVQGFVLDAPYIIDWLYKYTKGTKLIYHRSIWSLLDYSDARETKPLKLFRRPKRSQY
jgi:hypothetical protein